jgi:hypothetical protein
MREDTSRADTHVRRWGLSFELSFNVHSLNRALAFSDKLILTGSISLSGSDALTHKNLKGSAHACHKEGNEDGSGTVPTGYGNACHHKCFILPFFIDSLSNNG